MLPIRKPSCFSRLSKAYFRKELRNSRSFSTDVKENSEKPQYPPILDLSPAALKKREKQQLHDKYRKLNTVEEKLFALNLPRYWGWEAILLKEGQLPYDVLPFVKYVTRTRFSEMLDLPLNCSVSDVDPKDLVSVIKPQVQEAILFENFDRSHRCKSEVKVNTDSVDEVKVRDLKLKSILNQINRILMVNLSKYAPHLVDAEVDFSPRLEAFWAVGGFKRSEDEHRIRTEPLERDDIPFEWKQEDRQELEHWFQYLGDTVLQLRLPLPLEPFSNDVCSSDDEIAEHTLSEAHYSPDFHNFERQRRFGTSIPGFWPSNNTNEFGLLSFHSCNHLLGRPPHFGSGEHGEAVHAQAVLAGYAWLHGQASYQGFSTFNDITYPLVSQAIVTDGKSFSFYIYQLNTMLMHNEFFDNNKKFNICYGTPRLKLYDEIKGQEFVGWNDDVLLRLIVMYLNKISKRDYNMKPYVNPNEKYISEVTDIDERRIWLHNEFRFMYSNRPRSQRTYEIFDWEWIYKVKFQTKDMEPRRRPFECWQHPLSERKYNDYLPRYIPKHMRYPNKYKQKNYNTYFPDAF